MRGAHSLKAGFEYLRQRYLNRTFFQTQGGFTFSGIFTGGTLNGKTIAGNSAADFLLGLPQSLSISSPALEQGGVQNGTYYS